MAMGVNADDRRESLNLKVGNSETEAFRAEFPVLRFCNTQRQVATFAPGEIGPGSAGSIGEQMCVAIRDRHQ